jgi:hypothetical protein
VILRAGLDDVEKRKFFTQPGIELQTPGSISPLSAAIPTALSQLLHNIYFIINNVLILIP